MYTTPSVMNRIDQFAYIDPMFSKHTCTPHPHAPTCRVLPQQKHAGCGMKVSFRKVWRKECTKLEHFLQRLHLVKIDSFQPIDDRGAHSLRDALLLCFSGE